MGRILAVSNRLPVTVSKRKDNNDSLELNELRSKNYDYKMSSGGLVSALSALGGLQWLGWSGINVPDEYKAEVTDHLNKYFHCTPIFLSDDVADMYYNGFSNSILWPLFHYHPGEMNFDEDWWGAYTLANRVFAKTLAEEFKPGDLVWVHDYHLMLLPAMIREEIALIKPDAVVNIAYFLHIPFPTSEIYRVLPVRREILLGVLQSDLIGFHTYDYVRHFLSSVSALLQLETTPVGVKFDRFVSCGVFPLGTDPERFIDGLKKPEVVQRIDHLKKRFEGVKVFIGVDRLDYIKGIPNKLSGFDMFLEKNPEWIGKCVLIQLAVPSRQDVEEYQNLRTVVNELVGRVNGKYGSAEFTPVHFMHRSVDFNELIALYAVSDVCVVSSTRDGMNLVSYEYIACQQERHGQLILSEFTGASQSLNGSIIVNPWDMEELSNAFLQSLTLSEEKKLQNHNLLFKYVMKFTTKYWGKNIVDEMERIAEERKKQKEHMHHSVEVEDREASETATRRAVKETAER
ncbi:alpha,alpha-trehalose-phosphate synthase (UDP-forming) [Starmerella bacillaris]|uniref:Trehalose-6-phosphate synthase n=1 Tax=Starmerella bacillaris TaxID=1247836 RepID=A0AAV5RCK5_STABA|nr:alpha,alpha-trehalose-phosphate synthase (UDP-forming) [Starmerella bacillaris]